MNTLPKVRIKTNGKKVNFLPRSGSSTLTLSLRRLASTNSHKKGRVYNNKITPGTQFYEGEVG